MPRSGTGRDGGVVLSPGALGCLLACREGGGGTPSSSTFPPSTWAGTEAPPGGLGQLTHEGADGTVAKRDPARLQRGHSPVKRGHSAVIAPTAVRPRCEGLDCSPPAGLACAAIPPSDVFRNRGTRCTPGGGCAPCTLLGRRGIGTLPSLPQSTSIRLERGASFTACSEHP